MVSFSRQSNAVNPVSALGALRDGKENGVGNLTHTKLDFVV